MAWCHQATNHHQIQCRSRSIPYGITRTGIMISYILNLISLTRIAEEVQKVHLNLLWFTTRNSNWVWLSKVIFENLTEEHSKLKETIATKRSMQYPVTFNALYRQEVCSQWHQRKYYYQISNISHTKSQTSNISHLILQLSLPNSLKACVKWMTKM